MPSLPLLLIDAGNSRLKWAISTGRRGKITAMREMATSQATRAQIEALGRRFPRHCAVLSCVVPKLLPGFKRVFAGRIHIVNGASSALRLPFRYPKPAELGADRLAAAVAVHAEGVWPAIIVSCGTASAFTVLNAAGELCGGVIAPGLHTQLAALLGATAQLPATPLRAPRRLPAQSTQEAIRAGVLLSFQGGVREIATRLAESIAGGGNPRILLTGGDAHHLLPVFGPQAEVRPLLVMEGLRIMGTRVFASSL